MAASGELRSETRTSARMFFIVLQDVGFGGSRHLKTQAGPSSDGDPFAGCGPKADELEVV